MKRSVSTKGHVDVTTVDELITTAIESRLSVEFW